jgi:Mg2+/citrate symporter
MSKFNVVLFLSILGIFGFIAFAVMMGIKEELRLQKQVQEQVQSTVSEEVQGDVNKQVTINDTIIEFTDKVVVTQEGDTVTISIDPE